MEDGLEQWQMAWWWGVSWSCQQTGTLDGTACLLQGRFHILVPYRASFKTRQASYGCQVEAD
jgi:hypothetical protein